LEKILIAGIDGFLGNHLALELSLNFEIYGYVRNKNKLKRIKDQYKIFDKNDQLDLIFENIKPDYVINTIVSYDDNFVSNQLESNLLLPILFYELSLKNNVRAYLNTDTFFNNSKYNYSYLSTYTLSKKHQIEYLKIINKPPTKIINMKIFHMYGENDSSSKFINKLINNLMTNKTNINLTLGEQKRDFIYVLDVVNAYKIVLKNIREQLNFEEYEVGTGESISIKTLVESAKKITKSKSNLLFGKLKYRNGEIMDSISDNRKLIELGWKPLYRIENGLKKTIINTD